MPLQVKPFERLKDEYAAGEMLHYMYQGKHIAAILMSPVHEDGRAELLIIVPSFGTLMREDVPYNWDTKPENTWHFRE